MYSFQEYRSPQFEKKDIAVSSVALAISASPEGENVTESSMIDIFVDSAPLGEEITATAKKGDNLVAILKRNSVSNRDAVLIGKEMDKIYPVKSFKPNRTLFIIFILPLLY